MFYWKFTCWLSVLRWCSFFLGGCTPLCPWHKPSGLLQVPDFFSCKRIMRALSGMSTWTHDLRRDGPPQEKTKKLRPSGNLSNDTFHPHCQYLEISIIYIYIIYIHLYIFIQYIYIYIYMYIYMYIPLGQTRQERNATWGSYASIFIRSSLQSRCWNTQQKFCWVGTSNVEIVHCHHMEVSWNRGTPSHHPFEWDFPL